MIAMQESKMQLQVVPDRDVIPNNPGLEKALLAAILYNNDHYGSISGIVDADDFYSTINRKLYELVVHVISRGRPATPDTIRPWLNRDPALKDIGIGKYLSDVLSYHLSSRQIKGFAREIHEIGDCRRLKQLARDLDHDASQGNPEHTSVNMIENTEARLYNIRKRRKGRGFRPLSNVLPETIREVRQSRDRQGRYAGQETGITDLDNMVGGLQASDLIIIAARPSMGKTALATTIARNVASAYQEITNAEGEVERLKGGKVAIFSLEMSAKQLAARLLAAEAGIPSSDIRVRQVNHREFELYGEAARQILPLPIFIDDSGGINIAELALRARRLHRTLNIDLIIIDYIQLMRGTAPGLNRNYEIAEITGGLKTLARELDMPIIALSQLNRSAAGREDPRPQLTDLRDSGAIEQDADMVMFIDRKSWHHSRKEPDPTNNMEHAKWREKAEDYRGKATIMIDKNRNGPTGTINVAFVEHLTRFGNLAQEEVSCGDYQDIDSQHVDVF